MKLSPCVFIFLIASLTPFRLSAVTQTPAALEAAIDADYRDLLKKYRLLEKQVRELEHRGANLPGICQGRLTSVTGEPVTTTQTVNTRRIRFTPYKGNLVSLFHEGNWRVYEFSELTLDLNSVQAVTVADTNYDVFIYRSSGTLLALELGPAWTSNTARSAGGAISMIDGVYVLTSDKTRRFLGTIRTNASVDPERFCDTMDVRGIWNYYNRVPRPLRVNDGTNNWTYNLAAYRQANGAATNQLSYVVGMGDILVRAVVKGYLISNDATQRLASIGIGVDSSTTNSAQLLGGAGNGSSTMPIIQWAEYIGYPGLGFHTIFWNESCPGCTATPGQEVTFYGDNNSNQIESGLFVYLEN